MEINQKKGEKKTSYLKTKMNFDLIYYQVYFYNSKLNN